MTGILNGGAALELTMITPHGWTPKRPKAAPPLLSQPPYYCPALQQTAWKRAV